MKFEHYKNTFMQIIVIYCSQSKQIQTISHALRKIPFIDVENDHLLTYSIVNKNDFNHTRKPKRRRQDDKSEENAISDTHDRDVNLVPRNAKNLKVKRAFAQNSTRASVIQCLKKSCSQCIDNHEKNHCNKIGNEINKNIDNEENMTGIFHIPKATIIVNMNAAKNAKIIKAPSEPKSSTLIKPKSVSKQKKSGKNKSKKSATLSSIPTILIDYNHVSAKYCKGNYFRCKPARFFGNYIEIIATKLQPPNTMDKTTDTQQDNLNAKTNHMSDQIQKDGTGMSSMLPANLDNQCESYTKVTNDMHLEIKIIYVKKINVFSDYCCNNIHLFLPPLRGTNTNNNLKYLDSLNIDEKYLHALTGLMNHINKIPYKNSKLRIERLVKNYSSNELSLKFSGLPKANSRNTRFLSDFTEYKPKSRKTLVVETEKYDISKLKHETLINNHKEVIKIAETIDNVRMLFIAFFEDYILSTHKVFGCYILKTGLWKLQYFMPEIYFYLIWKLQTLSENKIDIEIIKLSIIDEIDYVYHLVEQFVNLKWKSRSDITRITEMHPIVTSYRLFILKYLALNHASSCNYYIYACVLNSLYITTKYIKYPRPYNAFLILSFIIQNVEFKSLKNFLLNIREKKDSILNFWIHISDDLMRKKKEKAELVAAIQLVVCFLSALKDEQNNILSNKIFTIGMLRVSVVLFIDKRNDQITFSVCKNILLLKLLNDDIYELLH